MDQFFIVDCLELPDPLQDSSLLSKLPVARAEKCLRYRKEEDRKRSLGAGIVMHQMLGGRDREITLGKHGKPELEDVFFSVSHAGRYACGVLSESPVGCDIEQMREPRYKVAEHFFSKEQQAYIFRFDEPMRTETFWRLWTLSESYMKMTGEGLSLSLRSFEVALETEPGTPVKGALPGSDPKSAVVTRDGTLVECEFMSTKYNGYIISVCKSKK